MKEKLKKIKKLLKRKCFASNYGEDYNPEYYLDVVKSIDNEGAVEYYLKSIQCMIEYCEKNSIDQSGITIYPKFSLYFDEKYEDRYDYIISKRIQPSNDILRIYINAIEYEEMGVSKTIDPDVIIENKEFVITFTDFKKILEDNKLELSYESFSEIIEDYYTKTPTVGKIRNCSSKINIKIRGNQNE